MICGLAFFSVWSEPSGNQLSSDHGATYSSDEHVALLERFDVTQSMDGRDRRRGNVVMERFWRTLKQDCVYVSEYSTYAELRELITVFMDRYNG